MQSIPNIIIPIIENGTSSNKNLRDELQDKRVIIFGVPGAFTPTCSEKHLPGFIKLYDRIKSSNIDDIYCLSVNDTFVMKAWLLRYNDNSKIKGIADGNGDISKSLNLLVDNSKNFRMDKIPTGDFNNQAIAEHDLASSPHAQSNYATS